MWTREPGVQTVFPMYASLSLCTTLLCEYERFADGFKVFTCIYKSIHIYDDFEWLCVWQRVEVCTLSTIYEQQHRLSALMFSVQCTICTLYFG